MKTKLIELDITKIKEGERFRKEYGDLEEFAENIKDMGIVQPITITENYTLVAGGRRLRAAKLAGLEKVPCIIRYGSDELDLRQVELVENLHRQNLHWVEKVHLIARVRDLEETRVRKRGSKIRTAAIIGTAPSTITRALELHKAMEFLPELANEPTEESAVRTLRKAQEQVIVKQLGKQHLENIASSEIEGDFADPNEQIVSDSPEKSPLHAYVKLADKHFVVGNALEGLQELVEIYDEDKAPYGPFQFIELDPPYAIELDELRGEKLKDYEEIPAKDYPDFLTRLFSMCHRVAHKNCWMIVWHANRWSHEVLTRLKKCGWSVDEIPALWDKGSGQTKAKDVNLARCYEPFYIARKGAAIIRKQGRSNIFSFKPVPAAKKTHPTQKPLELMREILQTFSYPGIPILVPFLGSGVTLRAAYLEQMTGIGWDLNQSHKDYFIYRVSEDWEGGEETEEVA